MASFVNGCVFTATSSGTGSFVVSAAVTGWQTPAQAGASNGATYRYRAYSADNTQWEIGSGVYTTGTVTLTRVLIEASSNGGAATNFTLPPAVALTMFDEDLVPFASPAFTGTPTSTTAAVGTNTTQIATTAYVVAQAAAATPLGNMATAVVGTSTRYARADHVHPGREVLTANRTYYVRTDGSDSNNGLADTSGGAKLTIEAALTAAAALDCSTYDLTVQVRDGTWTVPVVLPKMIGSGTFTLLGNTATPANCLINVTGTSVTSAKGGKWTINGFEVRATSNCIDSRYLSDTTVGGAMIFGACTGAHVFAFAFGLVSMSTGYTINGSSASHFFASRLGLINAFNCAVTVSGTPAFGFNFARCDAEGAIYAGSSSFTGAATGTRYLATLNAVINTQGGGASFFPGDAAGSTATGGQYA